MEMMSERYKSSYAIQTVENALRVLEVISEESGDFRISHLSAKLGMERSYVFRMLATFEQRGYVKHIESTGRYRVGLSAYETGGRLLRKMKLLTTAKPIMEHLAKNSGEAVYLAIPGEKDFLFLEMADSPQPVRIMSLVGYRFPLNKFSAGKVILAHNTTSKKLSCTQQTIQNNGSSIDHNAVGEEIGSLSVPIFNDQGIACASLCQLVPEFRLSDKNIKEWLLPLLKSAGGELSAKLGHELSQRWGP